MCEAYNPGFGSGADEECEWKYEPCGNPCPPTCADRNPTECPWKQLEGCYVTCKEGMIHCSCDHLPRDSFLQNANPPACWS